MLRYIVYTISIHLSINRGGITWPAIWVMGCEYCTYFLTKWFSKLIVDGLLLQKCAIDDDLPSFNVVGENSCVEKILPQPEDITSVPDVARPTVEEKETITVSPQANKKPPVYNMGKHLSCKWSTGNGPRISCVRDYPTELQFRALEQVNLSPRLAAGPYTCSSFGPIPSPRPSPKIHLSPRLSYMGLPSPRAISAAN